MHSRKLLEIELTQLAKDDLEDIGQYSFTRFGQHQMNAYLGRLVEGIERLARNPGLGRPRAELPHEYKLFPVEKHLLIFTIQRDILTIARILHQSRDIGTHV